MINKYFEYKDLIQKPYLENGCGPDGYDCWGVAVEINKRLGVVLPKLEEVIVSEFKRIDPKDFLPGDIVYVFNPDSRFRHVGVLINKTEMLHVTSASGLGVKRTRLDHPLLNIVGVYRYNGE